MIAIFYNDSSLSFQIIGIFSVERNKRDVFESPRSHTSLSYRISGNSRFSSGGVVQFAKKHSITYIPDGIEFTRSSAEKEKMIVLHLKCLSKNRENIEIKENASDLEPLFQKLLTAWEEDGPLAYNRCMALLYQIFEEIQNQKSTVQVPKAIAVGVEKLEKEYKDPSLSVASLAKACFVSEVYFRKLYRLSTGESPIQTIQKLRFQHALELMKSGYFSQKQAALMSGFSDVKYFRTAFKKRFGSTPSHFLKNKDHNEE